MNAAVYSSLPPSQLNIPVSLEQRFNVVRLIKNGPSGSTYLAEDMQPGQDAQAEKQRVVIKVVRTLDQAESQKIFRELEIHRHLKTKEVLKPILSGLDAEGKLWTVRPFVEGITLKEKIQQGLLDKEEAAWVAAGVAAALEGLHASGVLHRDVKPGHVLIASTPQGQAVLLFDAGCPTRLRRSTGHDVVGAPQYLAPEHPLGKPITAKSDLYATGVMFYEMLTGFTPFTGDVDALLHAHQHEFPSPLDDAFPEALRSLVFSLLSKDARDRPFSAAYVRKLLLPLLPQNFPAATSSDQRNQAVGLLNVHEAMGSMQTQELSSDDMEAMLMSQKANAHAETAEFGTQELDLALLHEPKQSVHTSKEKTPLSNASVERVADHTTEPLELDRRKIEQRVETVESAEPDESAETEVYAAPLPRAFEADSPFGQVTLAPPRPSFPWPKVVLVGVALLLVALAFAMFQMQTRVR